MGLLGAKAFAQPVLNEIHYDPPNPAEPGEFVELHNPGSAPVPLAGWRLTGGVEFTFPAGASLAAGGFLVVAQDPAWVKQRWGTDALGPWQGRLNNESERVELADLSGRVVDRVEYRRGFPWPTVGDAPGLSIELIHPALDNDLGGHWRPSVSGATSTTRTPVLGSRGVWKFLRGRSAPSNPVSAWRQPAFDDSGWETGALPIGYDPDLALGTRLEDMRNGYISVFLRKSFVVTQASAVTSLELSALYDDGFKVWINGQPLLDANMGAGEQAFSAAAGPARESASPETFVVDLPPGMLREGTNWIAVQAHNTSLSASSDFFFDTALVAVRGPTGIGPTPGRANRVLSTEAPPAVRQVGHTPESPRGGEGVRVSAKVTDPEGVASVECRYQVVRPGAYVELADPEYESRWVSIPMRDDGASGDGAAGDGVYGTTIPASAQEHRNLVRYRIRAVDTRGQAVTAPYPDDPQPNFAYFVYDGVPAWQGALRPGAAGAPGEAFSVDAAEMNRLPVLHLLARRERVEDSTWFSRYGGDDYPWMGTLVFRGRVYDHIRYRARGGVWRYAMTKNMWKFDFNRGHDFEPVDDWGRPLATPWTKLNLGASIQQGDYQHRGEQGLFESVGFRVFRLAGVPAMHSAYAQLRVIDDVEEAPAANQYEGDFWGVYMMLEQPDGRFLRQHGLPDGNLFKMEGGGGELNNLGPAGPADGSDLDTFLGSYTAATEDWWRSALNIADYLSYQTVVQAIHHYDICYDKNFFYYRNPETLRWQVIPWDLDLTWAENMYDAGCGGVDRIKQRLLPDANRFPAVWREWQNRIREFRDLFWNEDEAWRLIDEQAGRLRGPGTGPTLLDADRAQWDFNPKMADSRYSTSPGSKSGTGRFYRWPTYSASEVSRDFQGAVQLMKRYVGFRSTNAAARARALDALAADPAIPSRPTLRSIGPAGFPVNGLRFACSAYQGTAPFGGQRWRVGAITRPSGGSWTASEPWKYEVEAVWESGTLPAFEPECTVPTEALQVGTTYRVRVQFEDAAGRTSRWSDPVEFTPTASTQAGAITSQLRVTEVMFHAASGATNDFLELHNAGSTALELGGARFTRGIDFVFPAGTRIGPGGYLLVVRAAAAGNFAGFRAAYGLGPEEPIVGPYAGNLSDAGETVALAPSAGADEVLAFTYGDGPSWPRAADGAGHSLVPRQDFGSGSGRALDYGGNWRASAFLGGSPGRADPVPDTSVVLNEVVAHTDFLSEFDSNDWVEVLNRGSVPRTFGEGWYLSDDASQLRRWAIPPGTVLPAGGRVVFDEVSGFNQPRGTGFSLNKAGEDVFLSHFPPGTAGRVVDAVGFPPQENEWAYARVPDGGEDWDQLIPRTRATPNGTPFTRVAIGEILYHEGGLPTNALPAASLEFVEIVNGSGAPAALFNTNGTWRLSGGIEYAFPPGVTLATAERLVLVSFDPVANPSALAGFRSTFGMNAAVRVLGPYAGRLDNDTDRVALEHPQAPDQPGDPVTWVPVDAVDYHDSTPWPEGADGQGRSLNRRSTSMPGANPSSWEVLTPSPGSPPAAGTPDSDGDGLPDAWEDLHGLDSRNPDDAGDDADRDGASNADEFRAGTDPRDPGSRLRIDRVTFEAPGTLEISFPAVAGRAYVVEVSATAAAGSWTGHTEVPAATVDGPVRLRLPVETSGGRFHRLRVR